MPIVHDDNPRAARNVGLELDSHRAPGNSYQRAKPKKRYRWHYATSDPYRRTSGSSYRRLPRYKLYLKDKEVDNKAVGENDEITIVTNVEYFLIKVSDVNGHSINNNVVINELAKIDVITEYRKTN